MLGLPASTEISKPLPKKAIYAKFDLKSAQRDRFDADISKLTIVNAISSTTIPALQKGESVECIYVVDVALKRPDYDPKNIQMLSKLIYTPEKFTEHTLFEDNVKPDRTSEDLLFQVMLECNLPLSAKIEKKTIAGKEVFNVNDGYLLACFDEDVNETVIS